MPVTSSDSRLEVFVSAATGEGIEELTERLEEIIANGKTTETFKFPPSDFSSINLLYKEASVISVDYTYDGALVTASVDARVKGMLSRFIVKSDG
jgi:GTP-binding protein HflX